MFPGARAFEAISRVTCQALISSLFGAAKRDSSARPGDACFLTTAPKLCQHRGEVLKRRARTGAFQFACLVCSGARAPQLQIYVLHHAPALRIHTRTLEISNWPGCQSALDGIDIHPRANISRCAEIEIGETRAEHRAQIEFRPCTPKRMSLVQREQIIVSSVCVFVLSAPESSVEYFPVACLSALARPDNLRECARAF